MRAVADGLGDVILREFLKMLFRGEILHLSDVALVAWNPILYQNRIYFYIILGYSILLFRAVGLACCRLVLLVAFGDGFWANWQPF